jgi:hypothetical protein
MSRAGATSKLATKNAAPSEGPREHHRVRCRYTESAPPPPKGFVVVIVVRVYM